MNNNNYYVVYSKPNCGFCTKAKKLLESMSIDFVEVDVSKNSAKLAWLKSQGFRTVPQIYAAVGDDTEYVGGYTELHAKLTKVAA